MHFLRGLSDAAGLGDGVKHFQLGQIHIVLVS